MSTTFAPRAARSHVAQVARRAQSPRKVAAHRQPRRFEGLILSGRAHALIFAAGVTVSGLAGYAWTLIG